MKALVFRFFVSGFSVLKMIVGTEWMIDASGCDAEALRNRGVLREIFARILAELDLKVVGEINWHQFPAPYGITGLALLSESHLACHTYPEYGMATFNLYCCRERPRWNWEEILSETLKAKNVRVRMFERAAVDIQIKTVGGEL
jgi:S-adenosylmethionine decarboxylase